MFESLWIRKKIKTCSFKQTRPNSANASLPL